MRVEQQVFDFFLIPKAAREGDDIAFPSIRPDVSKDSSIVDDIKFGLYVAVVFFCQFVFVPTHSF
jgi:hypothetical protein